jgi:hypothetical protein
VTPIFHASLAALNVFLAISNYRQENYVDAAMHTLLTLNFFVMFMITKDGAPNDS